MGGRRLSPAACLLSGESEYREKKMAEDIKSELIENIDDVKTITIEAKDGKTYKIDNVLPVKAARLLESNIQILARMLPDNNAGQDPEEFEKASKVLNYVISWANIAKYPELTPEYIEDNFDGDDFIFINLMYQVAWAKMCKRRKWSEVAPPKKQEGEAEDQ